MKPEDFFPADFIGTAVEAGACDGTFQSTTFKMERCGWRVLCIEANPDYEPFLQAARKEYCMVALGATRAEDQEFFASGGGQGGIVGAASHSSLEPKCEKGGMKIHRVPVRTLDEVLVEAGITSLDFVGLDVEGYEPEVLKGFDLEKWAPRVMFVEDNWKTGEARVYMEQHGYRWHSRVSADDIFLREGA